MPISISCEVSISIVSETDVVVARQKGRALAHDIGFSPTDVARITATISELARNVLSYAASGEVQLHITDGLSMPGLTIIARDNGPGITNIERALQDGYSTSGALGIGLPGVRRLMDEFRLDSTAGGTTVTVTKWCRS